MATIIQQPPALCLSSMIDDIVFSTSADSGHVTLTLTFSGVTKGLINETVFPDNDGAIRIVDLPSLLDPYLKQGLTGLLSATLDDGNGAVTTTTSTVIFARVDVGMSASQFVTSHFLTILNGPKLTAYGREERLYAYDATSLVISAMVRMNSGSYVTLTGEISATDTTNSISQFNVSVQNIADVLALVGGSILSYTLTAGNRVQEFQVVTDEVLPAPSLVFTNSFGCQEFIHCVGTHKKASKYDRLSSRFMGKLRNYRVTEDRQFTANTGWLSVAMADWADELFRSEEVYLWVDDAIGREVVVSDSKSELTNEDNDMPSFEFTYGYAQRLHNVMQPSHAGRIFDNTFDYTFD